MSEKIFISVIIPVYNRRQLLDAGLDCLRKQTLEAIEFIIVDDGSSDGTFAYLQKALKDDGRFKVVSSGQNGGPAAARNKALAYVSGKYLGFFDIDDVIPADYFEALYKAAEKNEADIVYTSYCKLKHLSRKRRLTSRTEMLGALKNGALWDKIYRFDRVRDVRFEEGLLCADNIYLFDAVNRAESMFLLDEPSYEYVLQTDSVSVNPEKEKRRKENILTVCKIIMKKAAENRYLKEELPVLREFLDRSLFCYARDEDWCRRFDEATGIKREKKKAKSFKILWLKVKKFLHVIDKKEYKEACRQAETEASGLFDRKWYCRHYPKAAGMKGGVPGYYLEEGWKKGQNPGPAFDGNLYLAENQDVANAEINPLLHYLTYGRQSGRKIFAVEKKV